MPKTLLVNTTGTRAVAYVLDAMGQALEILNDLDDSAVYQLLELAKQDGLAIVRIT